MNAEAQLAAQTGMAKVDAAVALSNRRANIMAGHAEAQKLVDQHYQTERAAARKDAEAETAAWMRDMDAKTKQEPAPGRWFHSMNSFGKVLFLASLAFGSLAQSKNANIRNVALDMMNQEQADDIQRQKERLAREVDAMKAKGLKIDAKLAQRMADAKDDHSLVVQRLNVLEQAALERANAPGEASYKAAMLEAAQHFAAQKLEIAGQRVQRATAERESKLNRDAENARAAMTDRRTRDIAAAEIRKDYDLARITASAKMNEAAGAKFKDTRVLHPDITGIRVVDAKTGQPVATQASGTGGLVVSEKVEKEAIQAAQTAQDRYALLNRVSRALGADDDIGALLKRNPQLISDLQKIGYSMAKENDPRGIVTDKDLASGMESALGGDLNSLPGRIAAGTFSAGQAKLKTVVDKAIRDMPAKMSNQLGALVDAGIPGYEGNIRVDWTPKSVEIDEPGTPTARQIGAQYGVSTPLKAPTNQEELVQAQALEAKGVEALPPYKPGVRDKVTKTLEDFKGATPDTINKFAAAATNAVKGDERAVQEIEQARWKEAARAGEAVRDFSKQMSTWYGNKAQGGGSDIEVKGGEVLSHAATLAKKYGLTQLTDTELRGLLKKMNIPTSDTVLNPSRKSTKFEY